MNKKLVLLSILLTVFLTGCKQSTKNNIMTSAKSGDLIQKTFCYGTLRSKSVTSTHAPKISERYYLTVMDVLEEGTAVKSGDIVLTIDDTELQNALKVAENDLENARAELEVEKFNLENTRVMLDLDIKRKELALSKAKLSVVNSSTLVSKVELEKAELQVKMAELELNQAVESRKDFNKQYEADLKVRNLRVENACKKISSLQKDIKNCKVYTPCNGIVFKPFVRLNNETGKIAKGKVVSPGDKLMDILNLGNYEGIVYASQSDAGFLNQGDSVEVVLTCCPEKKFQAKIISKAQFPQTRNDRLGRNDPEGYLKEYEIIIELLSNDPIMKPGMSFKAEIKSIIAKNCISIPSIAIKHDKTGSFVLCESGKKYLTLGKSSLNLTQIEKGLSQNDQFLLNNQAE